MCLYLYRDYFFMTLKLNGPKFREHAKKLFETMAKIVCVPNHLTKMDDLHITVSKILIKDKIDWKILLETIMQAGDKLKQATKQDYADSIVTISLETNNRAIWINLFTVFYRNI